MENQISYYQLKKIEFIKSTDEKLYSLDDLLQESCDVLLIDKRIRSLETILINQEIELAGRDLLDLENFQTLLVENKFINDKSLFDKTNSLLSMESLTRDEKWRIFQNYNKSFELEDEYLREQLILFKNNDGVCKPLSKLMLKAPDEIDSGLLEAYIISPTENLFDSFDSLYMSSEEIWDNLVEDWLFIQPSIGKSDFSLIMRDFEYIYNYANKSPKLGSDFKWILSDESEWVCSGELFYNKKLLDFSEVEYDQFKKLVKRIANYKFIDYQFLKEFNEKEYFELYATSLNDISEKVNLNENFVSKDEIKLLNRIRINNEGFFTSFIINKNDSNYTISTTNHNGKKQFITTDDLLNTFLEKNGNYALLSAELYPDFRSDSTLKTENESFVSKLIEEYGAKKSFVNVVKSQGDAVKNAYLNRIDKVDLLSSSEIDSYDGKYQGEVLKIVASLKRESEFKEKVFVDGEPLANFIYKDQVTHDVYYNSIPITFSLAKLIGRNESNNLEIVKRKLSKYGSLFNMEEYPADDVWDELEGNDKALNEEQLAFIIAYHQEEKNDDYDYEVLKEFDLSRISESKFLKKLYRKEINDFERFLPDSYFHPSHYIWSNQSTLILPQERVPEWILEWEREERNRLGFLLKNKLEPEKGAVIEFRAKFKEERFLSEELLLKVCKNKHLANNTLIWIQEYTLNSFDRAHQNYKTCHKLIATFIKWHKELPNLLMEFDLVNRAEVICVLNDVNDFDDVYYINRINKNDVDKLKFLRNKISIRLIDSTTSIYTSEVLKEIEKIGITKAALKRKLINEEFKDLEEWTIEFYKKWLKEIDSSIKIFLFDDLIPFQYLFQYVDEEIELVRSDEHTALLPKRGDADRVLVSAKSTSKILALLSENQENLFPRSKEKLIRLLALAQLNEEDRDMLELVNEMGVNKDQLNAIALIINEEQLSTEEVQRRLAQGSNALGDDGYDLGKELSKEELINLQNNIDDVNSILSQTSPEQLKSIKDNLDVIGQLLETEDEESTPNQIIGHIGEVLIVEWLKLKHNNNDTKVIKHASIQTDNGEYKSATYTPYDIDFSIERKQYYIDVKSTIKSISDLNQSVAFFISRNEYNYIKEKSLDNYFIFRISLKDIGMELMSLYESIPKNKPFEEILKIHHLDIVEKIIDFLSEERNFNKVEEKRLRFKVSIPKVEDTPF